MDERIVRFLKIQKVAVSRRTPECVQPTVNYEAFHNVGHFYRHTAHAETDTIVDERIVRFLEIQKVAISRLLP